MESMLLPPEMDEKRLVLKYDFAKPVEIGRFSESLQGLQEIYRIQVARSDDAPKDLRLFISEIRQGSVEIDIVEMVKTAGGALAPIAAEVKVVGDALDRVRQVMGWLRGSTTPKTEPTKKEIEAVSHFVAPIAENVGSTMQVNVVNSPGAAINIGFPEANEIQNGATRALEVMKTPITTVLKEVPLVWVQTDLSGATVGRTGMKAIVEAISPSPMPVYFPEDERRSLVGEMVHEVEYPYKRTFIVDVEAIVVQDKLKGYKILRLHAVLD